MLNIFIEKKTQRKEKTDSGPKASTSFENEDGRRNTRARSKEEKAKRNPSNRGEKLIVLKTLSCSNIYVVLYTFEKYIINWILDI